MPYFKVNVQRTQIQSQTFVVKAKDKSDLEGRLEDLDFGHIDDCFDEGEVDEISYEVIKVEPCKKRSSSTFPDYDLQACLDILENSSPDS